MTTSRVPDSAQVKLRSLQIEADERAVLAGSKASTVKALVAAQNQANDPAIRKSLQVEIDEAQAALAEHQEGRDHAAALTALLAAFLNRVPQHQRLVEVEAPTVKDTSIDAITERLRDTRSSISELASEISQVRRAAPPKSDVHRQIKDYVDGLARRGRPRIKLRGDTVEIDFTDHQGGFSSGSTRRNLEVAAYFHRDAMVRQLIADADVLPEMASALSAKDRAAKLKTLTADLDDLERLEEALIVRAAQFGHKIARRRDASPSAVLGVRLKDRAIERVRLAG